MLKPRIGSISIQRTNSLAPPSWVHVLWMILKWSKHLCSFRFNRDQSAATKLSLPTTYGLRKSIDFNKGVNPICNQGVGSSSLPRSTNPFSELGPLQFVSQGNFNTDRLDRRQLELTREQPTRQTHDSILTWMGFSNPVR